MLQSFTGTFDAGGLRSLQLERDQEDRTDPYGSLCRFWAVLESPVDPRIRAAYLAGDRTRALRLISDYAIALGTIQSR